MGLADDLERLAALHGDGALSDDEYRAAKASLLSGTGPASTVTASDGPGPPRSPGPAVEPEPSVNVAPVLPSASRAERRGPVIIALAAVVLVALVATVVVALNGDEASCRSTAIEWGDRGRRAGARGIEAVAQEMRLEVERDDWRQASEVALAFVRSTMGAITKRDIEQFVDNSGVICANE